MTGTGSSGCSWPAPWLSPPSASSSHGRYVRSSLRLRAALICQTSPSPLFATPLLRAARSASRARPEFERLIILLFPQSHRPATGGPSRSRLSDYLLRRALHLGDYFFPHALGRL